MTTLNTKNFFFFFFLIFFLAFRNWWKMQNKYYRSYLPKFSKLRGNKYDLWVCTFTTCCIGHKLFRTKHDIDLKGNKMSVLYYIIIQEGKSFITRIAWLFIVVIPGVWIDGRACDETLNTRGENGDKRLGGLLIARLFGICVFFFSWSLFYKLPESCNQVMLALRWN